MPMSEAPGVLDQAESCWSLVAFVFVIYDTDTEVEYSFDRQLAHP